MFLPLSLSLSLSFSLSSPSLNPSSRFFLFFFSLSLLLALSLSLSLSRRVLVSMGGCQGMVPGSKYCQVLTYSFTAHYPNGDEKTSLLLIVSPTQVVTQQKLSLHVSLHSDHARRSCKTLFSGNRWHHRLSQEHLQL